MPAATGYLRTCMLAALAAAPIAGCASVDQPILSPEDPRKLESQRQAIVEETAKLKRPACDAVEKSYAAYAEFVDRHTIIAQSTGDIEGEVTGSRELFGSQFTKIMTAFEKSKKKKMLIYVNGGLNPLGDVRDQAANQIPCMLRDGFFPVFLIWQTGAFETYFEQISKVRNGRLRNAPHPSTPIYLAGDVGEGIVRSPITLWNSVKRYWDSTVSVKPEYEVRNDRDKARKTAREVSAGKPELTHPNYRNVTILGPLKKGGSLAGREIVHVLGVPVRLGTAPFLDAMGKTAWENMLRRTRTPVRAVWELQRPVVQTPEARTRFETAVGCFPRGTGVFAKFFQALEKYMQGPVQGVAGALRAYDECGINRSKERVEIPLTLIGHSMGTIVLNELIPAFSRLPYENIVYMAAAASIRDFQRSVPWVLRRKMPRGPTDGTAACGTHFYSLMLNPIAEARERSVKGWLNSQNEGMASSSPPRGRLLAMAGRRVR